MTYEEIFISAIGLWQLWSMRHTNSSAVTQRRWSDHISGCNHRTQMTVRGEHNDNADVNREDSVTSLDTLMIIQVATGNIELG